MVLKADDQHIHGSLRNEVFENLLNPIRSQQVWLVSGVLKKPNEGQSQFFGCFCLGRDGYRCEEQDNITAITITAKVRKNHLGIKTFRIELSTA